VLAAAGTLSLAVSLHKLRLRKLRKAKAGLEAVVQKRTQELRDALELNRQQAEKLRESDALKSRFITNVSHEFRTPLSITLGTLADVRAGVFGPPSPEAAQELDTVIANERKLLRLINQLMAIARLDSGRLKLNVSEHDMVEVARDAVAAFSGVARRRGISLECTGEGPIHAYIDAEWMENVVANLLSNALKFTPPGGEVSVEVARERESGGIRIAVRDTGPGIPAQEVSRVFDRFYQTELGASSPQAGIGVGLSLAKEIVDLHHGEIRTRSEPGSGTTFEIWLLPGDAHFDRAQLTESHDRKEFDLEAETFAQELLWEETEAVEPLGGSPERPVVLIAEDNRDLQNYLIRHLQEPYRLIVAGTGTDAWRIVQAEIPDLVICDVMMPGMDGLQLCRKIRECPETDYIPVLMLTARDTLDDRVKGLDYGADDYLSKPFEIAELKARIRNTLQSRIKLRTRITADLALSAAKDMEGAVESADTLFLRRVYDVIREHAQDMEFSVELLARELAVSRMHLYRRLRAIAGKSPADLLMEYRLERSAQLLAARAGTISEIAYGVGFKSVSHFTRRFREKFGRTPTDYRGLAGKSAAYQ
jgi:signal transduction histidine kinase/DNA-binding response OmpR family regulator